MQTRPLGRTGIQVSPCTLGTMMFGPYGNPDPDECVRIVHRALDGGITVVEETLGALTELLCAGKVRAIGHADLPASDSRTTPSSTATTTAGHHDASRLRRAGRGTRT